MNQSPDQAINESTFRSLQRGDQKAFRLVYEAYIGYVQYLCRLYFRDTNEQDDVIQEVFIKVYEKANTVEEYSKFKAWLGMVCRNTILDQLRRRARSKEDSQGDERSLAEASEAAPEAMQHFGSDERLSLDLLLAQELLSRIAGEPDGELFLQAYQLGLSVKELAGQRGEPVGTITSRLTRARKRFQELLADYLQG